MLVFLFYSIVRRIGVVLFVVFDVVEKFIVIVYYGSYYFLDFEVIN